MGWTMSIVASTWRGGCRSCPDHAELLLLSLLLLFFQAVPSCGEESLATRKLLTLGLITDSHYDTFPAGEKAPWESMHHWLHEQRKRTTTTTLRRYDLARDKMDEAISLFNSVTDMNLVVNLGDLVNNDLMWNLKPILDSYHRAKAPHYSVLGNHDLRAHNDRFGKLNKTQEEWLMKKLGLHRRYYTVDHPPFRFIFLDSMTNDLENTNTTTKEAQTKWLKEELDLAKAAERVTILFAHIPIGFETNLLGPLLKSYDQMPLVFSGHNHKGDYVVQGPHRVHCITLAGQIETLSNAFAVVEIFENRAELTGFGRVPSRILHFQPHVVDLLRRYQGPLRHNLTTQGFQPPLPDELWANEVLQKPPSLQLNIPHYRKPLLPGAAVQTPPQTRFTNEVLPLLKRDMVSIRGREEPVDLTSATRKRTLLINGVKVISETDVLPPAGGLTPVNAGSTGTETDSLLEKETVLTFALWAPVVGLFFLLLWTLKKRRRLKWRDTVYTKP
ncbi:serine/threonine protein phosphatase [Trypanosoma grayi]|uniref:serine/threonine protein phosphatase n=1 Tax=Trypanosoma grayi TaxID=71804 RepID=UPI0004F448F8|nr:serine/threonine protein phosphatase [Trypanosoma grayi]KEG15169.1 serine/threonine protein phosphatase [Trypanosoma grayi]